MTCRNESGGCGKANATRSTCNEDIFCFHSVEEWSLRKHYRSIPKMKMLSSRANLVIEPIKALEPTVSRL